MSALVVVAGALGLVIAFLGLPPLARDGLERRVDPYLSGLHGRPSKLLAPPARAGSRLHRWIERRVGALPAGDTDRLAARLSAAGFVGGPEAFRVEQATWAATAGVAGASFLFVVAAGGLATDLRAAPALAVAASAGGWLARDWWLGRQVEARRAVLKDELPTAIDLVTLSIMAGESPAVACGRVATAIGGGIGAEFARTVADMRAGATVVEALEDMARRIPDAGMARFVDALCTAIEKGAPLADVLRAQADDGREARRRHLLELGGRREVLMLVPVVFLIMPVVVVFALFPGLVSLNLLVP